MKNLQQLKGTLDKKHNYALELQHEASLTHTRDQKAGRKKKNLSLVVVRLPGPLEPPPRFSRLSSETSRRRR